MLELPRVLWIEDEAHAEYGELWAPVFTAGYDLRLAADATQAVRALAADEFAAVVVDIRILPGEDPRWIALFNRHRADPAAARLGLALLRAVLPAPADGGDPGASGRTATGHRVEPALLDPGIAEKIREWLRPERIGVLSVEVGGIIQKELEQLRIGKVVSKGPEQPRTALLELIRELIRGVERGMDRARRAPRVE